MEREFTEKVRERLKKQIDEVNDSNWNAVTDKLGDITLKFAHLIGVLQISESGSNVKSYQKYVIDMENMEKKKIDKIFKKVDSVDQKYAKRTKNLVKQQEAITAKINTLQSFIHPNFSIATAQEIKQGMKNVNKELEAAQKAVETDYKEVLEYEEKKLAKEAVKGVVASGIKSAVDLASILPNAIIGITTGHPMKVVSNTWDLVNDVYAVGASAAGLLMCGFSVFCLKSTRNKEQAIEEMEKVVDKDGLTELFEEEGKHDKLYEVCANVSKGLDTLNDMYSLADTLDGIGDIWTDGIDRKFVAGEFGFSIENSPLEKKELLKKYQKDFKAYQEVYKEANAEKILAKNVKTIYNYVNGFVEDGPEGLILHQAIRTQAGKAISESKDVAEDIIQIIEEKVLKIP